MDAGTIDRTRVNKMVDTFHGKRNNNKAIHFLPLNVHPKQQQSTEKACLVYTVYKSRMEEGEHKESVDHFIDINTTSCLFMI